MAVMKFRFKIQKYQTDAVESIVNVFDGQPKQNNSTYTRDLGIVQKNKVVQTSLLDDDDDNVRTQFSDDDDDIGFSNAGVALSDAKLLENIKVIQSKANLEESASLSNQNNLGAVELDVEMETGTGKTYVYIKTMFELNKRYGWSKFIVVVPSIAIREGVKKSFEMTQTHFMDTYGQKVRFFIYDSAHLNKLDDYSKDNKINVMIINIQAFNKSFKEGSKGDSLIIYSERDNFQGRRPIDVIAKNRPIIIMDEPQKMGGDATQKSLKNFNPLFTINYSATHKVKHNLVYVLDALDAYNQRLVKKIEVKGFTIKNLRGTNGYMYLQKIIVSKDKAPRALIEIEIGYNKSINRETRYFDRGDSIYETSKHMEQYQNGYVISDIDPINNSITLINGETIYSGEAVGDISENDIRRIQIRETIISHFKKEEEMFYKGIKVLSLFFIDEVVKYRQYDEDGNPLLGIYGKIFEEEYNKELQKHLPIYDSAYKKYLENIEISKTHKGYFSIDKKGKMIDSKLSRGSEEADDVSAYNLILKDKERLLSFEEPTRFIFSHSALREGWDNPNVFQICTLKHSTSDVQRHQEVGRGLRLCVNSVGERMDATIPNINVQEINKLTVIANESYEEFVNGLQSQIKDNLFNRPNKIDPNFFKGKKVISSQTNDVVSLTNDQAQAIYFYLIENNYIDFKGNVTKKYKDDKENNKLVPMASVLPELSILEDSLNKMITRVYDTNAPIDVINGNGTEIESNDLNKNFNKKEFQELWKAINHKYAYTVEFDSNELINNAIMAIDSELNVTRLVYTVSTGEQRQEMSKEELDEKQSFTNAKTHSDAIISSASDGISYDLLGKVREKTQLTRKTVAIILSGISPIKFLMFKENPEEFVTKVSRIINDQKATLIVEHVQYKETDEIPFSTDIFTQEKSKSDFLKAFKAQKSIQDYVFTDGIAEKSIERTFAENLDNANEVVVYAKLPKDFYIPTPVGNYSPDWAIAFKKNLVKHVYFIAETKGSMDSLQLKGVEKAKIECAKKLFNEMSKENIYYNKVSTFDDLMNMLRN